jgi:5'-3' exonuclease
MGIPSYFAYVLRKHSDVVSSEMRTVANESIREVACFYVDSNSVIYDLVHEHRAFIENDDAWEKQLVADVCARLEQMIRRVAPKRAFIAFDGVVPFAKMKQQRQRRYRSMLYGAKAQWNTAAITPGTSFMKKLNAELKRHFALKNTKAIDLGSIVTISTSDEPGEGEHKIFAHLRSKKHRPDENVLVYGLDADLIMLAVLHAHWRGGLWVVREAPAFGKFADKAGAGGWCFLNAKRLALSILDIMCLKTPTQRDNGKLHIADYIFLCFLLGNDFLPRAVSLHVRENGVHDLITIYRECVIDRCAGTVVTSVPPAATLAINWKNLHAIVNRLSQLEFDSICNHMQHRRQYSEQTIDRAIDSIPRFHTAAEDCIAPRKPGWKKRYYETLLYKPVEESGEVCDAYLKTMEWTLMYYSGASFDWKWAYPFEYAPLMLDLKGHVHPPSRWTHPVASYTPTVHAQLAYVLPFTSLHLLPKRVRDVCLDHFALHYKRDYPVQWAFCSYLWEAHVVFPPFHVEDLETALAVPITHGNSTKRRIAQHDVSLDGIESLSTTAAPPPEPAIDVADRG